MGNLIKSIVISTLGLFTIAFISTSCNKETVEQLKVKKASRIYIGDGTPLLDKGEAGDYMNMELQCDKKNVLIHKLLALYN